MPEILIYYQTKGKINEHVCVRTENSQMLMELPDIYPDVLTTDFHLKVPAEKYSYSEGRIERRTSQSASV